MKPTRIVVKRWCLALVSTASLVVGVVSLQSCGGEGGSIGNGGGGGGGNGSITAAFTALQPPAQHNATYVGSAKCGTCHGSSATASAVKLAGNTTTRGIVNPNDIYDHWLATKHAGEGVGCEQCHGPGSAHASAPATTNILTFPNSTNPIVCAQCHGPIYDDWKGSAHAKVVPDPVEASANLATATGAQCFVCHSGLVRTKTEQGLVIANITQDQATELVNDTYNSADPASSAVPFTASCVTCHNPHSQTGNLDQDGDEHQLWHAIDSQDTSQIAPATTPAQFVYFNQVCAECHNGRGANGADTKLQASTARPNMHDSPQFNMLMGVGGAESGNGPPVRTMAHAAIAGQCVKCHMPDSRHSFTVSYDTSCTPCHTAADAAARMTSVRGEISNDEIALQSRLEQWAQNTFGDSTLWDYTTLIPAGHTPPDQTLIPIEVKRARHNYYFILRDASIISPHNPTYARYLIQVANDNLDSINVPAAAPALSGRSLNSALQQLQERAKAAKVADASSIQG